MTEAVVVTSGGMDSTTALYLAYDRCDGDVRAISFDYGQRHKKELVQARLISNQLRIPHDIIDLGSVTRLIGTSSLTNPDQPVPEGHYEWDTMKQTVVPNRNAMMANIGIAVAVATNARAMYLGIHAGDHAVYPDCRPEFVSALQQLALVANEGFINPNFEVFTPFLYSTKADIVLKGVEIGVPFSLTWTCYNGGHMSCGRCSTCVERLEAFATAGYTDPLDYVDRSYWQQVVADAPN